MKWRRVRLPRQGADLQLGFVRCHSLQSVCFTGVATENQALQNKLITKGFGGYKTLLV